MIERYLINYSNLLNPILILWIQRQIDWEKIKKAIVVIILKEWNSIYNMIKIIIKIIIKTLIKKKVLITIINYIYMEL